MLYVTCLQVLRHVQIHQNTSCCRHARRHFLQTKTLQRTNAPEFLQPLACRGFHEHPVFQLKGEELGAEPVLDIVLPSAQVQYLFRRKIRQQFVDIIVLALPRKELTGRDIQKRHTGDMFVEMQACHPVVLFLREGGVGIAHTRRH